MEIEEAIGRKGERPKKRLKVEGRNKENKQRGRKG